LAKPGRNRTWEVEIVLEDRQWARRICRSNFREPHLNRVISKVRVTPPAFELDVFVRDAPHVLSRRSMSAAPLSGLIARIRRNRLFGVTHNVNRRSYPKGRRPRRFG
jgi:hypothetical protein